MGFLFFIFTLILILFVNLSINKKNVIIESFIKSIIQYSLFIVISTEVLSKFNLINFEILLSLYLIFWCSSIFYLVKNEFYVLHILKKIKL